MQGLSEALWVPATNGSRTPVHAKYGSKGGQLVAPLVDGGGRERCNNVYIWRKSSLAWQGSLFHSYSLLCCLAGLHGFEQTLTETLTTFRSFIASLSLNL